MFRSGGKESKVHACYAGLEAAMARGPKKNEYPKCT
jgi:hypothetical protein